MQSVTQFPKAWVDLQILCMESVQVPDKNWGYTGSAPCTSNCQLQTRNCSSQLLSFFISCHSLCPHLLFMDFHVSIFSCQDDLPNLSLIASTKCHHGEPSPTQDSVQPSCVLIELDPPPLFQPRGLSSLWLRPSRRKRKNFLGRSQVCLCDEFSSMIVNFSNLWYQVNSLNCLKSCFVVWYCL